jgi:hypothetical protein
MGSYTPTQRRTTEDASIIEGTAEIVKLECSDFVVLVAFEGLNLNLESGQNTLPLIGWRCPLDPIRLVDCVMSEGPLYSTQLRVSSHLSPTPKTPKLKGSE